MLIGVGFRLGLGLRSARQSLPPFITRENLLTPQPHGGVTGLAGSIVAIPTTLSRSTWQPQETSSALATVSKGTHMVS